MTSSFWKAQIPISKLSAVEKALLTAFETEIVDDIQELKGGLSPALVYRIQVKGKQYILRVVMLATILNSPARQYACMKLAADAGIAPPVLYSSPEDAVTIVEYIQTHPLPFECEAAASLACHLASTIRHLHGLPPFPMFINYLDALDLWIQGCRASIDPRQNDVLKACLDKYSVLRKAYPNDPELVSSHNDLNINNLLFDGERVWIIDWEASCLGDRFVDLANIANSFLSTPEQEERYLRVYFGDSLDDTKRARFYLMRQACHLFYALVLYNTALAFRAVDPADVKSCNVPRLRVAYERAGDISIANYEGQAFMTKVFLNEAWLGLTSPSFDKAIRVLEAA